MIDQINATPRDRERLEQAYAGRCIFHGELHDHSASGGTSDGKCPLDVWKKEMAEKKLDFAAILDHRQVRHMYLPEWDDALFICGTEPGTHITDTLAATKTSLHYNMLFTDAKKVEEIVTEFPEYAFTGGPEGHFVYPNFTRAHFGELIDAVRAKGGHFVIPHPKQILESEEPLDYWFRDNVGIEVFYETYKGPHTAANYPLWVSLLAAGKRVWASAGSDYHAHPDNEALTSIYADRQAGAAYIPYLREGDYTCGQVGIRMILGSARSGGHTSFAGERMVLAVGDFHSSVKDPTHVYRVDILTDKGIIASAKIDPDTMNYFALDAVQMDAVQMETVQMDTAKTGAGVRFCRTEVWDETQGLRIALGNPIWNDDGQL